MHLCGKPEQFSFCTTILVSCMDLILSARPQLADHSVHGFQEHVTLLQEPEFYSKEKETFNVET